MNPRDMLSLVQEAHRRAVDQRMDVADACTLAILVLGAWVAVLPAVAFMAFLVAMMLGSISPVVPLFALGTLLVVSTVLLLRSDGLETFAEQACIPALLAGMIMACGALALEGGLRLGCLVQVPYALLAGAAVPRRAIRVLCGIWATVALLAIPFGDFGWRDNFNWEWLQVILPLFLVASTCAYRIVCWRELVHGREGQMPRGAEDMLAGAGMVLLAYFWLSAAPRWLISWDLISRSFGPETLLLARAASLGLALLAVLWLLRRWPDLRNLSHGPALAALVGLAWFAPAAGPASLIMAVALVEGRWPTALGAAAVVVTGVLGLYADLDLTLRQTALMLVAVSAVLATTGWLQWRSESSRRVLPGGVALEGRVHPLVSAPTPELAPLPAPLRWKRMAVGASALVALLLGSAVAYEKEAAIRTGRTLFVELRPVDPRSVMQGDYMNLSFGLPQRYHGEEMEAVPRIVAQVEANGVAQLVRYYDGHSRLEGNEMLLKTRIKDQALILGSDAFFFAEGEGARYQSARYGEFRVGADGQMHLVGLRDAQLKAL
jgi:uncharacterized membrane-anchored protein